MRNLESGFTGLVRGWIVPLAVVLGIFLPFRAAVADWYHVPSGSMRPTILEGDRIFVHNIAFGLRIPLTRTWLVRWSEPARGDVVTLASPEDGKRLVKRCVGVAGDRIAMVRNQLVVNGETVGYFDAQNVSIDLPDGRELPGMIMLEDLPGHPPHAVTITAGPSTFRSFAEVEVPEGMIFVMGDNRDMSLDSRSFGFVPVEHVYGRGSHVVVSGDPSRFYLPRFERWFSRLI